MEYHLRSDNTGIFDVLDECRRALDGNPYGNLPRANRVALLLRPELNRTRRFKVLKSVLDRLLPIWRHRMGRNDLPERALAIADMLVHQTIDPTDAKKQGYKVQLELENMLHEMPEGNEAPIMVGFAAEKGIWDAMSEVPHGCDANAESDERADAWSVDPAFFAAIAAAGGSLWESQADGMARRDFWKWWLDQVERQIGGGSVA